MTQFDDEEAALLKQLEAVRAARATAALTKDVSFNITKHINATAYLQFGDRQDIVDIVNNIDGRGYRSYGEIYAVPVASLDRLIALVKERPNVKVTYAKGIEESIHDFLYAPNYVISVTERNVAVKVKMGQSLTHLRYVPGFSMNHETNIATIPKIEAWRLHDIFEKIESVMYTEDAKEFIIQQLESRAKLDVIAKLEDVDIEVPGFKGTLRNFQKVALKFFEVNGFRGIDADEMGLGKTPTAIAAALLIEGQCLVVVPASLKTNWAREIKKFTDEKFYVLQGRTPAPFDIVHIIKEKPKFVIINYDILGTNLEDDQSYVDEKGITHEKKEIRFPWIELLNICKFALLVGDEVHYIKNVDALRSRAFRKLTAPKLLGLTGTPILNRPGEFWPILTMLKPELFPSFQDFVNRYTWNGKSARNVDELRTALRPTMIRRLKRDVMKELPAINRINEMHELSPKALKVYTRILNGVWAVMKEWDGSEGRQESITNMLVKIMRLKQVCAIDTMEETADLATRIYDSADEGERAKKVLIFSQFKPTAYGIAQRLGGEALCFVNRTESGFDTINDTKRQQMVDRFQKEKDIKFLVVTEKTAKEGYNITAAMAVIFNDLFWTPAAHQQAEGRAYGRVADLHPIDSYYMVKENTIMEWIQELLQAKLNLIENVVEGVNASRTDESIAMSLIKRMRDEMWVKK